MGRAATLALAAALAAAGAPGGEEASLARWRRGAAC